MQQTLLILWLNKYVYAILKSFYEFEVNNLGQF